MDGSSPLKQSSTICWTPSGEIQTGNGGAESWTGSAATDLEEVGELDQSRYGHVLIIIQGTL